MTYAEAIEIYLVENENQIFYKGKKVKVNLWGILKAYEENQLEQDFEQFIEEEAEEIIDLYEEE